MGLPKYDTDPWGANVSFMHIGQELQVDVGMAAEFSEFYLWTTKTVSIPFHASWTPVTVVQLRGIWNSYGFDIGANIGVRVGVVWAGQLPANDAWMPKIGKEWQGYNRYMDLFVPSNKPFTNMGGLIDFGNITVLTWV